MKYTLIPRSHEACKKKLSCRYLAKKKRKKEPKNSRNKKGSKTQKRRKKDPPKKEKSTRLKNQDPHPPGKTHKLMEEVPQSKDSVKLVVTSAHDPICKEEDAFTLSRRGLCVSMTFPKSSQTINKPKTHKNKTKRNSKTP